MAAPKIGSAEANRTAKISASGTADQEAAPDGPARSGRTVAGVAVGRVGADDAARCPTTRASIDPSPHQPR